MSEREVTLTLALDDDESSTAIAPRLASSLGVSIGQLPPFAIKKRSLDARHGRVRVQLVVVLDPPSETAPLPRAVSGAPVLIVGTGPAGLFCAYELARHGVGATLFERGKQVQARRVDLKGLNQEGRVDPDSNYCFGEGGAGTYSDGKLYTRSHKRGDVRDVLQILHAHGAPAEILVDARPHIGSNLLPRVVTALRERLEACGVTFRFGDRVTALRTNNSGTRGLDATGGAHDGSEVVLATGHSARDVLRFAEAAGLLLEAKPFAAGVRIEHPQPFVDARQYGRACGHPKLPPAAYRLAYTEHQRGVFSFCMCPGGWIVPASTEAGALVVNGMSLSRRDSPFANSGLVVGIEPSDWIQTGRSPLWGGIELQAALEAAAWTAGGAPLQAPATRVTDFVARRGSTSVPKTSYFPGLAATDIADVLAQSKLPLADKLRVGLLQFDKQMKGYVSEEAILVGVESRTSSPIRVVRDAQSLQSPTVSGVYPCGEGAGYAGGIVSAALDGMAVARAILRARGIALLT